MTEKERLDKIAELKSEMRSMLDTAQTEKRDFSPEEQDKFEKLDAEVRMHGNYFRANEMTPHQEEKKEDRNIHDIFGDNLRKSIDNGGKVKIEVRANIPINSEDIKDTVPVLFKDVIDVLSPALIINKVGSRMLYNVQGTPTWPTIGDVEANWVGENVSLVDKSIDFGALRATPRRLGIKIKVSRRALNMSNLDLYSIVVGKIGRAFAAAINQALVSFTKVAAQAPEGVFVKPALTPITLNTNPTLKDVVGLETAVMNQNVGTDADGFGAYIIGTAMRGKLKTTPIDASSNARMILEGNTMNGYPVVVSNYMPANTIGFGFFEYSVISQFGNMDFTFDPVTGAGEFEVKFIGNTEFDITVLRNEAFVVGTTPEFNPTT